MKPDWNTPERMTELGACRFLPHSFIPPELAFLVMTNARHVQNSYMRANYTLRPIHLAQLFSTSEDTEFGAATNTIAQEYFWKTFTGEWNVNNTWNDYVNRWRASGGQQIIDAKKRIAIAEGLN